MTIITTVISGDKISSHVHVPEESTNPAERKYGTMLLAAIDGTIEVIGDGNSPLRGAVEQLMNAFREAMIVRDRQETGRTN